MKTNKFLDWAGITSKIDYARNQWVGRTLGWFITLLALGVVFGGLSTLVYFLGLFFSVWAVAPSDLHEAIRNVGLVLVAVFGAPFVAWRATVAQRQVETAQRQAETAIETLFNEKVKDAISELAARKQVTVLVDGKSETHWTDDMIRRAGAIDRLESLAAENPKEVVRVARLLSTYIREVSKEFPPRKLPKSFNEVEWDDDLQRERCKEQFQKWKKGLSVSRHDLERAVQSLLRLDIPRKPENDYLHPDHLIDLKGANLQKMHLANSNFAFADLRGANLQGANIFNANFENANLRNCDLQGADLSGAKLEDADLNFAKMQFVNLEAAEMIGAELSNAQLQCSCLYRTQLTGNFMSKVQMQGADVRSAQLTKARMSYANLNGACLFRAEMNGAQLIDGIITWTRFDETFIAGTNFQAANLTGSHFIGSYINSSTSFKKANVTFVALAYQEISSENFSQSQLDLMFADSSVELHSSLKRPEHWLEFKAIGHNFGTEWNAWKSDPDAYSWPDRKHLYTDP